MPQDNRRPKFIAMDGVEGCGKTTQCGLLAKTLIASGRKVTLTREPGGTIIGEKIRALLLDPGNEEMTPLVEALLFTAARAQLVAKVLVPELRVADVVICDRWVSSTFAYQGYGGPLPLKWIETLTSYATTFDLFRRPLTPDLVIILDLDPAVGFGRKGDDALDRMEQKGLEYHQRVRQGFLEYAKWHPEFCKVVDATGTTNDPGKSKAEVHRRIIAAVNEKFEKFGWNIQPVRK